MKFFPDSKSFVSIFGVNIAWYAIIILIGALVALQLTKRDAKKRGINPDDIEDIFYGVLLFGVLGARLWYVLFHPNLKGFLANPVSIFAFRDGGLAIQGGLVAGALYTYYKAKKLGINFMDIADSAMPNVLMSQVIGRWGNFVNQEAFGEVVSEAYFKFFPEWFKNTMYINGEFRQPMFFYESVLNLLGFILIKFVLPKFRKMKRGDYFYSYLVWYGFVRIGIEHFRTDSLVFFGLKSAQVTSVVFIIIGLLGFKGLFRKKNDKVLVLFDFDGTIADTGPLILKSFDMVFEKYFPEIELSEADRLSFIGPTLKHSFTKYTGLDDVELYVKEYKSINMVMQKEALEEIENSSKLLSNLYNKDMQLGVVSSKMKDSLQLGVDLLEFNEYLDVVIGGDEVKVPKPDPQGILDAKKQLNNKSVYNYYVGDTATDILAANAAGFVSIGVVTTKSFEAPMREAGADYIVYDLMEIEEIIEVNINE